MALTSHVVGAGDPPLVELTLGEALDQAAERWGEHIAVVSCEQDIRWTYRALKDQVDALARALARAGLQPGERIGILSPNRAEWVVIQFATAAAGLILVNINPAYRENELEHALRAVGCAALVTAARHRSSDYLSMLRSIGVGTRSSRTPDLRCVIFLDNEAYDDFISYAWLVKVQGHVNGTPPAPRRMECTDPVNIQYTSGTTGKPKAATLSHRNILNNGRSIGATLGLSPGDKVCIPVPLFHCFGMVIGNLACVTHGATMVFPSASFDAGAVVDAIERERCDFVHGVPTMFSAELHELGQAHRDMSSLRGGLIGGAPCPQELLENLAERMNLGSLTIVYGMTETSPISFQTSTDDSLHHRVTTVGRIQPHLEAKIVDGQGDVVPRGEPGEILVKGYSVMLGYWRDPAATHASIDSDGWMHTGDLGVLDDEGYCKIVGRLKDMVIRGGENIYPREVEEVLLSHPLIRDVQVFGIPHPHFGEEVAAWIISGGDDATEEEIVDFCRPRIASFKIPRYLRFVDAFPLTASGKPIKHAMRAAMTNEN